MCGSIFTLVLMIVARSKNFDMLRALDLPFSTFPLIWLAAIVFFVSSAGLQIFVRGAVGLIGRTPLSPIVTDDFGRWTLRSLLRWREWRKILRLGLEAGITGAFIVCVLALTTTLILTISYIVTFSTGRVTVPDLSTTFALFVVVPLGIIAFTILLGFPLGVLFGLPVGVLRVCRQTARFVSIHSPYQRLRAGIVFNIVQLVLVSWGIVLPDVISRVSGYWSDATEFTVSSLFPSAPFVLLFGFAGLFRTAMFKHLILRLSLWFEGYMPLRYARFLDYGTDLGILEREGGQWRFRHQILQVHFANRHAVRHQQ